MNEPNLEPQAEAKKPIVSKPRKRASIKQRLFAEEYVASRGNGTQSALKVYDTDDPNVANNIASENLRKPIVRREIEALLVRNNIKIEDILGIHSRNMHQDKHLPTSQKAVDSFYEILGMKSNDKPTSEVKIAFVIQK